MEERLDFCYDCYQYTTHKGYICDECYERNFLAQNSLQCQCDDCDCAHEDSCVDICDCKTCAENGCYED